MKKTIIILFWCGSLASEARAGDLSQLAREVNVNIQDGFASPESVVVLPNPATELFVSVRNIIVVYNKDTLQYTATFYDGTGSV